MLIIWFSINEFATFVEFCDRRLIVGYGIKCKSNYSLYIHIFFAPDGFLKEFATISRRITIVLIKILSVVKCNWHRGRNYSLVTINGEEKEND